MPGSQQKRILYIVEAWAACAWYRCHTPGMALRRRGHEVVMTDRVTAEALDACDVIVFQRPSVVESLAAIREANARGKTTVVDVDDDMWNLHRSNPAYGYWHGTGTLAILDECIRSVTVVTAATRPLAELVRPLNRDVRIIPNMLPAEHWPAERVRPDRDGKVVIGWAGSSSHQDDLQLMDGPLQQVLDAYPNAEVVIAGPDRERWPFAQHPRMDSIPWVKIEQLADVLDEFDIGLAPLVKSRFNRCKSDLKFVEYAMIGIPVIASKLPNYEGTIEHGVNGFLAQNAKDWLRYLRRLVEEPDLREELGRNARAYAETRTADANVQLWERAYGL